MPAAALPECTGAPQVRDAAGTLAMSATPRQRGTAGRQRCFGGRSRQHCSQIACQQSRRTWKWLNLNTDSITCETNHPHTTGHSQTAAPPKIADPPGYFVACRHPRRGSRRCRISIWDLQSAAGWGLKPVVQRAMHDGVLQDTRLQAKGRRVIRRQFD